MTEICRLSSAVSAVTGVATIAALRLHRQSRPGRIKRVQMSKLLKLLQHAYRNVPYYREQFDSAGFRPGDLKSTDDLSRLPILIRSEIQSHPEELISRNYSCQKRSSLIAVRTTGSSGSPLQILLSPGEYFRSLSYVLYGFFAAGADLRDTFVHIHVPQQQTQHYAFESLGILRQLHLDLRAGEGAVLKELQHVKSPVVYAFPSFLQLMSRFILEQRIAPPEIKLIVSNGEVLTDDARACIQRAFRCPVYDSYGAAEIFRIACECQRQRLHILPDASIVEIDERTQEADGSAEIVVTPLYLRAMPLIRYKLGDRVLLSDERCDCGCSWPIISRVIGRSDDFLTLPSGRRISARALNLLDAVPGILEYQIIQRTRPDFLVSIRPSKEFGSDTCVRVKEIISAGCAPESVHVDVETVESIPRSATGKMKAVISRVDR